MTRSIFATLFALSVVLAAAPVWAADGDAPVAAGTQSTEAAPAAETGGCMPGGGCCGGGEGCAAAKPSEDGTPARECACQRRRRLQEKAKQLQSAD
jgi:hypothetical protein